MRNILVRRGVYPWTISPEPGKCPLNISYIHGISCTISLFHFTMASPNRLQEMLHIGSLLLRCLRQRILQCRYQGEGRSRSSESAPSCLLLSIFLEKSCSFIFNPLYLNTLTISLSPPTSWLHLFNIPVSTKPHLLPICSKSIIMVQK